MRAEGASCGAGRRPIGLRFTLQESKSNIQGLIVSAVIRISPDSIGQTLSGSWRPLIASGGAEVNAV
jgi:hypothetical protein